MRYLFFTKRKFKKLFRGGLLVLILSFTIVLANSSFALAIDGSYFKPNQGGWVVPSSGSGNDSSGLGQLFQPIDRLVEKIEFGSAGAAGGAAVAAIAPQTVQYLDPRGLRYSQTSAGAGGDAALLRDSMSKVGWQGPAIDAVQTADGVTVIDNTRPAVALDLGIKKIPVNVHDPSDLFPAERRVGVLSEARTWGEALEIRTGRQIPPLGTTGDVKPPILMDTKVRPVSPLGGASALENAAARAPQTSKILQTVAEADGFLASKLAPVLEKTNNILGKLVQPLVQPVEAAGAYLAKKFPSAAGAIADLISNPLVKKALGVIGGVAGVALGGLALYQGVKDGIDETKKLLALIDEQGLATFGTREGAATGLRAASDWLLAASGGLGMAAGVTAITGVGGVGFGAAAVIVGLAALALQGGAWLVDGGAEKVADFAKGVVEGAGKLVADAGTVVKNTAAAAVNMVVAAPKVVYETATRVVEKLVPVVKTVTEYVKTQVEEAYQYAVQVPRKITETVVEKVQEAYEVIRQVPRQVTEWVNQKVEQTKVVAKTVYDTVKRSYEWFEDKVTTVWDEVRRWGTRLQETYEDVRNWVGAQYETVRERVWGQTGNQVRYEDVPVYGMVQESSGGWIRRGWNWFWNTTTNWVSKIVRWTRRQIIEPVYGWVTRTYDRLVQAGHWVVQQVRKLVPVTYDYIERTSRQIFERVRHVREWFESVPRTVYETVKEWVEVAVPVVKTVYDDVRETAYRWVEKSVQKTREVIDTVWQTGTRLVEKLVPVTKEVTEYVTQKVEETYQVASDKANTFQTTGGSVLATVFNDKTQLADHKDKAVAFEEFLNYSRGRSLNELQHEEDAMERTTSDRSGGGPDDRLRYVIDPADSNRVIDMRHFLVVGPQSEGAGLIVEIAQSIPGMQDPTGSSFHNQDFFSNALGARFFEQYDKNKDFSSQLEQFLKKRIRP